MAENYNYRYVFLDAIFKGKGCYDDPVIKERLKKECEVDLDRPKSTYDFRTVQAVILLLAHYYHPNLTPEYAQFELGYAMFGGYCQTVVGRITMVVLQVKAIAPERILRAALNALNNEKINAVEYLLIKVNPTKYIFGFCNVIAEPYFNWGLTKALVDRMNLNQPRVTLEELSQSSYNVIIEWKS